MADQKLVEAYRRGIDHSAKALSPDSFSSDHTIFHSKWALLTAGNSTSYNTMTISWGGLGTLWNMNLAATVYVRPNRYTYGFMEKNDLFTVSFYPDSCREALLVLGTESGRDMDKVALSGLKPVPVTTDDGEAMTFREAEVTLLCRKRYWQDLDVTHIIGKDPYADGSPVHRMYIGEVLQVL